MQLGSERDAAIKRTNAAGAVLLDAAKKLEAQRGKLYAFRKETFENYVAQNPPPPNYDLASKPVSTPTAIAPAFPEPEIHKGEESASTKLDGDNMHTTGSPLIQMPERGSSGSWGSSASCQTELL